MNENKMLKVLDVVIKVANVVATFAQILANTFKTQTVVKSAISQEDAHMVKDFFNGDIK